MLVLAGDIGGTSARLATFRVEGEKVAVTSQEVYPSRQFTGIVELVRTFVSSHGQAASCRVKGCGS